MKLEFNECPPGLNGGSGMIRAAWEGRRKEQDHWKLLVMEALEGRRPLFERCVVIFERRSYQVMDWDNCAASFKLLGDAMVQVGVLKDDGPAVVLMFLPLQKRVHTRAERGCSVEIIEVNDIKEASDLFVGRVVEALSRASIWAVGDAPKKANGSKREVAMVENA